MALGFSVFSKLSGILTIFDLERAAGVALTSLQFMIFAKLLLLCLKKFELLWYKRECC